jgi:N-acetylated-alpha-linked acidic dipeptidase
MIDEKRYVLANDPKEKYIPPVKKEDVPYLDFSSLQNAIVALEHATTEFTNLQASDAKPNANTARLNQVLYQSEQKLLVDTGLPRRAWYKHTIYAPGFYTGYGVKTLPGIREAIEQRNWKEAQEQIEGTAKAIGRFTAEVKVASELLSIN